MKDTKEKNLYALPSLELMSNAPQADGFVGDEPGAPYRSSGGRGEMEGNRGYETLREYFIEDVIHVELDLFL